MATIRLLSALLLLAVFLLTLAPETVEASRDVQSPHRRHHRRANNKRRCAAPPASAYAPPSSAVAVSSAPPAPSSAPASPAPSSGSTSGSSSGKVGLAWPNGPDATIFEYTKGSKPASWYYTWSPHAVQLDGLQLEFVPMLWGRNQISEFQDQVKPGSVKTCLGFNEPNEGGQANMSPQEGADLWKQYLEPLRGQGVRLGSPATSSNPNGLKWVQDMLTACNGGCNFDFVVVHWYDVDPEAFISYINLWHDTFKKNIWVTEWACQNFNNGPQCSQEQVFNMWKRTTGYMDSQSWVERYSWFGSMRNLQGVNTLNALQTPADGTASTLTDLGRAYVSA